MLVAISIQRKATTTSKKTRINHVKDVLILVWPSVRLSTRHKKRDHVS